MYNLKNKTRDEVLELVAGFKPKATKPRESIKPVTVVSRKQPKEQADLFSQRVSNPEATVTEIAKVTGKAETEEVPGTRAESRYELKFTVTGDSMDKYNQVKSLLSAKYPRGMAMEEVFNKLLV